MKSRNRSRPFGIYLLTACLLFLSLGGFYGGVAFLVDPSGGILQVEVSILKGLPLKDFTLPGLFLLVVYGILPLILLYSLWQRPRWAWMDSFNRWSRHHWTWTATVALSLVLIVWISIQLILIGFQAPVQAITALIGVLLLILSLLPSVQRYYVE